MKPIAIHYIEIRKDAHNVPKELVVLRYGAAEPKHIQLRGSEGRDSDIAGASRRGSIDAKTGSLLQIAGKFISH